MGTQRLREAGKRAHLSSAQGVTLRSQPLCPARLYTTLSISAAYTHKQSFRSFGSLFRKVPQSSRFEIGKPMSVSSRESVFYYSATSLNLTTGETKVRALPLAGVPVSTLPL